MKRLQCDACGRCNHDHATPTIQQYKVKRMRVDFLDVWWQRVDVCDECWKALTEALKRRQP